MLTKATTGDIGQHKWDTVMGDLVCSSVEISDLGWIGCVLHWPTPVHIASPLRTLNGVSPNARPS